MYQNAPHAASVPVLGHPKAEKLLMTLKDDNGDYIYRHPGQPRAEGEGRPLVWGEPFVRDPNILTNLGSETNETRLFAGDFAGSALVGQRQGLVVKTNPWAEPYFSYNQTAFLAEVRIGFNLSDEKRFAMLSAGADLLETPAPRRPRASGAFGAAIMPKILCQSLQGPPRHTAILRPVAVGAPARS